MALSPSMPMPFVGVDPTRVIKTFTNTTGTTGAEEIWQATEDCYLSGTLVYIKDMGNDQAYVRLADSQSDLTNNTNVIRVCDTFLSLAQTSQVLYAGFSFPVKKGQWVKVRSRNNNMNLIKAYGLL